MNLFLLGAISMGSAVAALLFLRFWRRTRDRLFLYFGASFLLEAINRALFAWNGARSEEATLYYLVRLLAYGLILWAIVEKNIVRRR
ncbi:DUF5985 family protein [Cognatiluteimonas profundi]|uniref:DUF5985 family protein n=1 Tax=Cognatiluteimonas profundi TaxID=2594501 RepID=UPI00131E5FB5|nr:DUF5985 family protein [Lysobacter profundi]